MGGVNHLADAIRIIEQCEQTGPVAPPYGADGRELLIPLGGKSFSFLLDFLDADGLIDFLPIISHCFALLSGQKPRIILSDLLRQWARVHQHRIGGLGITTGHSVRLHRTRQVAAKCLCLY